MILKKLSIVIIGTGNLANHLAKSLSDTQNIDLVQVFNYKNSLRAKNFAKTYLCNLATNYKDINPSADLYIIAVKDDAITEVVENLKQLNLKGLVVHTSGSIDMDVLTGCSKKIGVYYPLQTFSVGSEIDWKSTPLLIESNSKAGDKQLKFLANSISQKVNVINSAKRLQIHLAAVFACNFTNALCVSAFELIEKNVGKQETKLLLPLMKTTFSKLEQMSPKKAQTGPAVRDDKRVMNKHLALLNSNKELKTVYQLLSNLIIKQQVN